MQFGSRKTLEKYQQNKGTFAKMFEKLTSSVDRQSMVNPNANANRKASQVEPELAPVEEEQA